jgi:hypothetical protein
MSLTRILQKTLTEKNTSLIFVANGDAPIDEIWYSLTDKGRLPSKEIQVDYNAVRGYLDEKGITYSNQGETSIDWVLKLKKHEDIVDLMQFLAKVNGYAALEARTHSDKDDEKIKEFKNQLVTYASKYRDSKK